MSYFLPFIHDIITQNITHSKTIYLYRDHSASTSLGKGGGEGGRVDEEISKKWHSKKGAKSKRDVPHTYSSMYFFLIQSFLLGFTWIFDNSRSKKVVLFSEIGQVNFYISFTRPHSRMCIKIYIFNLKTTTTITIQKVKETKE